MDIQLSDQKVNSQFETHSLQKKSESSLSNTETRSDERQLKFLSLKKQFEEEFPATISAFSQGGSQKKYLTNPSTPTLASMIQKQRQDFESDEIIFENQDDENQDLQEKLEEKLESNKFKLLIDELEYSIQSGRTRIKRTNSLIIKTSSQSCLPQVNEEKNEDQEIIFNNKFDQQLVVDKNEFNSLNKQESWHQQKNLASNFEQIEEAEEGIQDEKEDENSKDDEESRSQQSYEFMQVDEICTSNKKKKLQKERKRNSEQPEVIFEDLQEENNNENIHNNQLWNQEKNYIKKIIKGEVITNSDAINEFLNKEVDPWNKPSDVIEEEDNADDNNVN